jgi:hypothetical protein
MVDPGVEKRRGVCRERARRVGVDPPDLEAVDEVEEPQRRGDVRAPMLRQRPRERDDDDRVDAENEQWTRP